MGTAFRCLLKHCRGEGLAAATQGSAQAAGPPGGLQTDARLETSLNTAHSESWGPPANGPQEAPDLLVSLHPRILAPPLENEIQGQTMT